jgi:hypothetical protein
MSPFTVQLHTVKYLTHIDPKRLTTRAGLLIVDCTITGFDAAYPPIEPDALWGEVASVSACAALLPVLHAPARMRLQSTHRVLYVASLYTWHHCTACARTLTTPAPSPDTNALLLNVQRTPLFASMHMTRRPLFASRSHYLSMDSDDACVRGCGVGRLGCACPRGVPARCTAICTGCFLTVQAGGAGVVGVKSAGHQGGGCRGRRRYARHLCVRCSLRHRRAA